MFILVKLLKFSNSRLLFLFFFLMLILFFKVSKVNFAFALITNNPLFMSIAHASNKWWQLSINNTGSDLNRVIRKPFHPMHIPGVSHWAYCSTTYVTSALIMQNWIGTWSHPNTFRMQLSFLSALKKELHSKPSTSWCLSGSGIIGKSLREWLFQTCYS